jgi:hypothetical protein
MLTRRRNLPVGFMASLTAAALLIRRCAAQRSGTEAV